MVGRGRKGYTRRRQRGRGIAGELLTALGPVAKEVALESGKYGARRLINKLKLGGKSKRKRAGGRKGGRRKTQAGGVLPLLALIPALAAAGKAAALGATGAAAGFGVKEALKAATR